MRRSGGLGELPGPRYEACPRCAAGVQEGVRLHAEDVARVEGGDIFPAGHMSNAVVVFWFPCDAGESGASSSRRRGAGDAQRLSDGYVTAPGAGCPELPPLVGVAMRRGTPCDEGSGVVRRGGGFVSGGPQFNHVLRLARGQRRRRSRRSLFAGIGVRVVARKRLDRSSFDIGDGAGSLIDHLGGLPAALFSCRDVGHHADDERGARKRYRPGT